MESSLLLLWNLACVWWGASCVPLIAAHDPPSGPVASAAFTTLEVGVATATTDVLNSDIRRASRTASNQWKKGAVVGGVVGVIGGAVLGAAFCGSGEGNNGCAGAAVLGGVFGGGLGVGLGALVGSAFSKDSRAP